MNPRKLKLNKFVTALTLMAFIMQLFAFTASAQLNKRSESKRQEQMTEAPVTTKSKIAPDLEQELDDLVYGRKTDGMQRVIIQLKSATTLNEASDSAMSEAEQKEMLAEDVTSNRTKAGILVSDLHRINGEVKKSYNNVGLVSAELPLSRVRELMENENVAYISPDREVESFGHIETVIGASQNDGRTEIEGFTSLNGTGVGIAVLDSGIDPAHNSIKPTTSRPGVVYSKTYTTVPADKDYYGHGTHVASLLAGDNVYDYGEYTGIAYESRLISLGVLDGSGKGTTSNVVAAIDWVIANKSTYNIRVINMSLGTPPKDSYKTDPLCLAARRAYNAGIVVVASAGNFGKDLLGNKIYGGINSPGIEPSVITVGAINTFGTDNRYDDAVATFSSRGPTRGYTTVNGVRKYDNLIKPDIVAPGNKLIAACSPSSVSRSTSLINLVPTLNAGGTGNDKMMYLSGTSMAAPLVTGAVAMLLEARPDLTPALVKALLMYSAQPIRNANTLEQGAGMLNVEGALEITKYLVPNVTTLAKGSAMLTTTLDDVNDIEGSGLVYWGKGIVTNYGVLYGNELMSKWQGAYANGVLVSDGTTMSGTSLIKSSTITSSVSLAQGAVKINLNGVLVSDSVVFMSSNTLSNGSTLGQGVLVSDGVLVCDGVLVSDGGAMSSASLKGDNTTCMMPW